MNSSHTFQKMLVSFAILVVNFIPSHADDKARVMDILPTKDVIYIEQTGLPGNTKLCDLLKIIPQLIGRGEQGLFSTYEVQYDGKSVGNARDAVLMNTFIGEVEKVEVTSSPTVTQQNHQQGGVINIIPRPMKPGFGGDVAINSTTEWDVSPVANLSYKNDRLEMRGNLMLEYYSPLTVDRSSVSLPAYYMMSVDSTWTKYSQQTAKLNVKYTISERDLIKAWVWESGSFEKRTNHNYEYDDTKEPAGGLRANLEGGAYATLTESDDRSFGITALAEYEHEFRNGGKMKLNYSYFYKNEEAATDEVSTRHFNPNDMNGELKFVVPVSTITKGKSTVEAGLNSNYSRDVIKENRSRTFNISPFGTFKYEGGSFSCEAGAKYLFYQRSCSFDMSPDFSKKEHVFLGNANFVWNIDSARVFRVMFTRNIIRPGDDMLYPQIHWNHVNGYWVKGDPELNPAYVNTVDVGYTFEWEKGRNEGMANFSLKYHYATNIFEQHRFYDPFKEVFYYTYLNSEKDHVLNLNATGTYAIGIFSSSLTGNLFYNVAGSSHTKSSDIYYNLCLNTIFRFRKMWTLSLNALYNSKRRQGNTVMGDYFYSQFRVIKSFNGWAFHIGLSDLFHYQNEDFSYNDDGTTTVHLSNLYPSYLEVGATFRFGSRR